MTLNLYRVRSAVKNHNLNKPIATRPFENEYKFVTTDDALQGDQYTNKTTTRVKLEFHVKDSHLLSDEEKENILIKLKRRINEEGYLQVFTDEYREQTRNKHLAEKRFYSYLTSVFKKKKKSIPAKHSEKKIEKRNPPSGQAGKRRRKSAVQKITYKGPIH